MSGKVTDIFKASRSGRAPVGPSKKPAEAVPSGQGVAAAAAAAARPEPQQQSSAEEDERTLRQFDLNSKFGPCAGMTRLERFDRAVKMGLEPPNHIRELVLRHGKDTMFNHCVWEHPY